MLECQFFQCISNIIGLFPASKIENGLHKANINNNNLKLQSVSRNYD